MAYIYVVQLAGQKWSIIAYTTEADAHAYVNRTNNPNAYRVVPVRLAS